MIHAKPLKRKGLRRVSPSQDMVQTLEKSAKKMQEPCKNFANYRIAAEAEVFNSPFVRFTTPDVEEPEEVTVELPKLKRLQTQELENLILRIVDQLAANIVMENIRKAVIWYCKREGYQLVDGVITQRAVYKLVSLDKISKVKVNGNLSVYFKKVA